MGSVSAISNTDETVTVSGTATNAEKVKVTLGTNAAVEVTPAPDGTFTYTSGILAVGNYDISVVAIKGEETSEAKTTTAAVTNVAPTIESVTNVNGNQLVVVFSEKVNKALVENTGNSIFVLRNITTGAQHTLDASDLALLGEDGKTLTINLDKSNGETTDLLGVDDLGTLDAVQYRLFINPSTSIAANRIKDLSGNDLAVNTYKDFTGVIASDSQAPSLVSAALNLEAGSNGQLVLTASEIAQSTDASVDQSKITIGGVSLTSAAVAASGDSGTIIINLTAAQKTAIGALTDLTVNVQPGAFKDVAGNDNIAGSVVATKSQYAKLQSSTWNELDNTLTLVFDQGIDVSKFTDFASVSLTGNATRTLADLGMNLTTTTNGKTVVFTATDSQNVDLLAFEGSGVAPATHTISFASGVFKTVSGLSSESVTAADLTYENDDIKPVIESSSYEASTNLLHLVFSEPVLMNSANFASGNDVQFFADGDDTTQIDDLTSLIQADMKSKADGSTQYLATDYAKEVWIDVDANAAAAAALEGITDKSSLKVRLGNADVLTDTNSNNSIVQTKDTQIPVTYNNATATTCTPSNQSLRLVKLTFNKDMDASTVTKDKFTVALASNANVVKTVQAIIPTSDARIFFLDLGTVAANQLTATSNYKVSYSSGMKDTYNVEVAAGNITITAADDATTVAASAPAPTFVDNGTVGVNAGDKIVLTYAEPVTVAVTNETFRVANPTVGTDATIAVGDKANQVVITLGQGTTFALNSTPLNLAVTDINDYKGLNLTGTETRTVAYPADAAVPAQTGNIVYKDVDANGVLSAGDTITIPYNVDLDSTQNINESNITVLNGAGSALNSATTFTATESGKILTITFDAVNAADVLPTSISATVGITGSGSNIKSLWGREAEDLSAKQPTLETTTKPYITSANYDNTNQVLRITFSEAISTTASPIVEDDLDRLFVLSSGYDISKDNLTTIELDSADTTNRTVKLTFTATPTIDEGITTINVIAGGATTAVNKGILDFDGNQLKRNDATGVVIGTYVAP
ncbi:Hypothetical protein CKL_3098 [Clostridium kluyveri DSM 555]|uniref:Uncharacterized protein n=1 Tax=Clostridium kluyveri (strain ATCC 8527 / DSM 555 / NBRC 12016 / NCIMB 10680 / K1) TaxID=431943 RepID=A5N1W0_CLOK5|nr:Hypothetical protein CKL_3098 [Clostridium kluyveri DSM 555]